MPSCRAPCADWMCLDVYSDDSDGDFHHVVTDPDRTRRAWVDEHYDQLVELFHAFKQNGELVFGSAHYQNGGFHPFICHTYDMMMPHRYPQTND